MKKDELEELYEFLFYNKINILLIENNSFESEKIEKLKIIDSDLCEINPDIQKN